MIAATIKATRILSTSLFALSIFACTPSTRDDGPVAATITSRDAGKTTTVAVGAQFEVALGSPRGVAPEYRFSWSPTPSIEGRAVRFVRHEFAPPPDDVDGGSSKDRYRFEATAAGTAMITIDRVEPGAEADDGPFRVEIVVE